MRNFFKRKRPTVHPAEHVTTQADILTAHMWGLTLTQWWALTDFERAECRRKITVAPKFEAAS